MANWEQPHWSGRPQQQPDPRPRLKPNVFARLARASAHNAGLVIVMALFLAGLAAGLAAFSIRILPASAPAISLDAQTAAAQASLDRLFPGIDKAFYATIGNSNPAYARDSAVALAAELRRHPKLFAAAFVPGTGPFYDRFGILYQPTDDVTARVTQVLQMQPLFHALAASPDLSGLAALAREIANAVAEGRSPPLLERVMEAAARTVEGEIAGKPAPVDWVKLAGLRPEPQSKRWYIIAEPAEGQETAAADAAILIGSRINKVTWSFPPHTFDGRAARLTRDLGVPALLSAFVVLVILGAGLGSAQQSLAVLAAALVSLAISAGLAAGTRPTFDAVTSSLAAAVLAPGFLFSLTVVIAYGEARARGKSVHTALMLAAHRGGPRILVFAAIAEVLWLTWLPRQIDSLVLLAIAVAAGIAVAALLALTLVPAILAVGRSRATHGEFHWLDDAVAIPAGGNWRNLRALLTLLLVAAAVFCTIFVPNVKFGDPQLRDLKPGPLDTPNAIGAVHLLTPPEGAKELIARIGRIPEVGAIRWIEQFMPVDIDAKLNDLKNLAGFMPAPAPAAAGEAAMATSLLPDLDASLKEIANGAATGEALRATAQHLRRALQLFASPGPPAPASVNALEGRLFARLAELPAETDRLAALPAPAVADLDEGLRRHFVAGDRQWRIEVLPKAGVTSLSFAAAMRRLSPEASGVPVVALARNEIMHHESILALGPALLAALLLAVGFARRPSHMVVAAVPTPLALSLCAAALVTGGELVDAAALAALSTAVALSFCASLVLAIGGAGRAPDAEWEMDVSFRSAILPLAVTLAAILPMIVSGSPAIAEFAYAASLFLAAAIVCNALIGVQLLYWLDAPGEGASGE